MALNDAKTSGGSSQAETQTGKIAPLWIGALFLFGLLLLYPGSSSDSKTGALSWLMPLGVLLTVVATGLRAAPSTQRGDAGPALAKLLLVIQALGVVGALLAALVSDAGAALLGLEPGSTLVTGAGIAAIIAISVSALSLLFAETALYPMREAATVEVRRVAAAAASGAILALAGAYGSLFVYAASQAETQADFSYFKTSQPGEATVKLVQSLATPLEVTGFFPEVSQVRKEVQRYLGSLKEQSGNLEFAMADRYLEPKKARELRVTQDGTLVLKQGETSKTLFVGTDIDKARAKLVKLDKEFNERLNKIARKQRVAYLTVGHGELNDKPRGSKKAEGRTGAIMRQLLEQQNYRIRDLGTNQGLSSEVPDDADLVLVLGPSTPFSAEEISTLKRYADAGGKVFMALDMDAVLQSDDAPAPVAGLPPKDEAAAGGAAAAPGSADPATDPRFEWLVQLAATVGADFEPVQLADEKKHVIRRRNVSDHALLQTNRFSTHASVSTLSRNSTRAAVVAFGAGHLRETDTKDYDMDVTVRTYSSAFPDRNQNFKLDEGEASKVYNLGMALTKKSATPPAGEKPSAGQKDPKEAEGKSADDSKKATTEPSMRAFVFADADAFSDLVLARAVNNRMLAFDAVRWLVGEESLAGEIESEEDVTIEPSKSLDTVWFYLTIFGMPALVLGFGLFISQRARRTNRSPAGA